VPEAAAIERMVRDHLEALGARYELIRIDSRFANTAAFCAEYGYSMERSANCILVVAKTGPPAYSANLVQATRRLDVNRTVRRLMGVRKASFAGPEETVERTGMLTDGVTPFGLPADLPIHVDEPIVEFDRVIIGGGSRALKILVDPEVFTRMPGVKVVGDLSRPAA
jgi:prolyl-tRNA editing enzyme YbaK/EbsC (Cys-tRNA(Pro) deacylase)